MVGLADFLDSRRCAPGTKSSHTCIAGGAFDVTYPDYGTFLDVYCSALEAGRECSLTEKPGLFYPVIADVDLAYKVPGADPDIDVGPALQRVHAEPFIKAVAVAFARALVSMRPRTDASVVLEAIVMQRAAPYVKSTGLVRDGLHVAFPKCVMSGPAQALLRRRALPAVADALATLPGQTCAVEDSVDACYCERGANWQMYGSNKPGRTPYLATHAVKLVISGGACVSCVSDAALNPRDWRSWVPQLSVQTSTPEQAWSLGDATEGEVDALEQAWAERRFADLQDNGVMEPPNRDPETESLWGKDGDAAKARGLVKCLNAKRADTYHTWRDVGFALYATSPELADAWHEFSAKSGKYDRRVCQMFWDRLGQTHHGGPRLKFGSLVMWAKEDSPTQLDDLKNDTLDKILHSAIKGHSHTDWGEYVREAMLNTLASVRASGSGRDRNLYTFSEHRWHYEPDGASVKNFLKKAAVDHVQSQLDQFPDDEELKKNGAKAIGLLKNKGFRDSVVGDITESVADNSFQDKLDTQRHLIGWKNGVFDLVTQKFRDGRPEDYITLSTGHVYLEPGTQRYIDASVEFDAFFAKVHTNLALRKYCLDSLAVMLSGTIFFEHMHCWTGCGSNGKSKFMKLLDEGLGDYMKTLPPSLITGARPESGKATPELCSAAGARIVILPEMDGKATINVAIMKELTGGDKIAVRALYGAATVIRPQFTMIMTCNDLSKVDSNDEGTWRRLKVLPYKSTFVLNQEDCLTPQTFVAENDLDARFKDWAPYVVSMLQARYPSALLAMRTEPAEITAEVKTYRLASDRDADFVAQNLVKKTEEDGDAWEDADAWALLDIYKREGRDRGVTLGKLSEKLHRFDIPKAVLDDATGTATIPGYRLAMRGRG